MLKRVVIPAFLLLLSLSLNAQTGREWIVSGQQYYKMPVVEEGVYAVPFTQLNSAGISTSSPEKLQIWFRGVEQSIAVANNTVYFLGKGNDGTLDSLMYEPVTNQPNKFYSLYSDTAYYFVTLGANDGKRLLANNPLPTATENYHTRVVNQFFVDTYSRGAYYNGETQLSTGDWAEGWFSNPISQSGETPQIRTYEIPIAGVSTASTEVNLEIFFAGMNNNTHHLEVLIGNSSSSPAAVYPVTDFYGYSATRFKQAIPISLLSSNQTLKIHIKVIGTSTTSGPNTIYSPDKVSLAHIILSYPEVCNVAGKTFDLLRPFKDNNDKTYSIAGFTDGSFLWDVSSEGNFVAVPYTYSAGTATANIASSASKLLYATPVDFKAVLGIKNVDMTPYSGGAEMLIITHNKLMSAVADYVTHRSSPTGGNLSISVAEVNKLYDLYSYGERHPIAIKRYCAEQLAMSSVPKYLFIIGKGVHLDYYGPTDQGNFFYRKNPTAFINNTYVLQQLNYRMEDLVPTFGVPASDLYFTITDQTLRTRLITSRLSARTIDDVKQYLAKVDAHQKAGSSSLWRKNLIHLSGGKTNDEIAAFRAIVDGYKVLAEAPRFGGKVVKTFTKSLSAGTVDDKLISSISDEVNKGVSYMTFFGHSSPSIIDLDIGNVSNPVYGYKNPGKYPVLMMNGCESAEYFTQGSIAENWIMTAEKGAIMAMGHGHIGYPHLLNPYTTHFYRLNFNDTRYIDATIGELFHKSTDTMLTSYSQPYDELLKAHVTQFNLQGDPALKMYKPLTTDYAISGDAEAGEKKVFIKSMNSDPITAMSDSFAIALPIINYGLSSPKQLLVRIKHTVTNNNKESVETYPLRSLDPIGYCDTVYLWIRAKNENYFGLNKFEIMVDPRDSILEFNENNNIATLEYFFPLTSVSCLYPVEYSVVYEQPVTFVAQSIDLYQTNKNYYVEIDTSYYFNSPAKVIKTIQAGATVKFTQTLLTDVLPSDSIVYYWRIRFSDLVPGEDTLWGQSSFIYIKSSAPGWSQSKQPQFYKDDFRQLKFNNYGHYSFVQDTSKIFVKTKGNGNGDGGQNVEIGVNNNSIINLVPVSNYCSLYDGPDGQGGGMYVVVFNAESALPYLISTQFEHACGIYDNMKVQQFQYLDQAVWEGQLFNFLNTSVKNNEYVLILSGASMKPSVFSTELKDLLYNDYGARHINDLTDKSPYILLTRKKPGATALQELYTTKEDSVLTLSYNLAGQFKSGSVTSTLIGPASAWGTLYKTIQTESNDQTALKIIRFNNNGKPIDSIDVALAGDVDLAPLIDANTYPYIKLLFSTQDTVDLTPSYLKKWQVIYAPTPEGTIDPVAAGVTNYINIPTKLNGETFELPFVFENISTVDFPEPLRTVFTLKDERGNIKRDTITIGLLPKGHDTTFTYTVNTANSYGKNILQVYVNPRLQREVYYQNNVLEIPFNVQIDKVHPVLGVMFDGVHIFDGDLVSPRPHISAVLVDDNNLITLSDTSTIEVVLEHPGQNITEQIFKNSPGVISWGPDPQKKGRYAIEYMPPQDFADGKYKLTIKGRDASGNRSSAQNLEVHFEVINASTITNFYPYPNPFSSSCRFVFTLTGKEVPEDVKIQIMTVSGKVVREIFKHELGPIHVGDNITDYAWDGRDEFGDKLANGVYIYRVVIKNRNDNFEHRETAGDKAFKKGYGKLYILR